jgi:hypothetical protein
LDGEADFCLPGVEIPDKPAGIELTCLPRNGDLSQHGSEFLPGVAVSSSGADKLLVLLPRVGVQSLPGGVEISSLPVPAAEETFLPRVGMPGAELSGVDGTLPDLNTTCVVDGSCLMGVSEVLCLRDEDLKTGSEDICDGSGVDMPSLPCAEVLSETSAMASDFLGDEGLNSVDS